MRAVITKLAAVDYGCDVPKQLQDNKYQVWQFFNGTIKLNKNARFMLSDIVPSSTVSLYNGNRKVFESSSVQDRVLITPVNIVERSGDTLGVVPKSTMAEEDDIDVAADSLPIGALLAYYPDADMFFSTKAGVYALQIEGE